MSDKPKQPGDDILEQIITDGLNQLDGPPRDAPPQAGEGEAPSGEHAPPGPQDGQTPPKPKKDKRSSVYIYLVILFGAAFLMLLLAYFVQRRSSATTISDLRNSMTLSRDEMMKQIEELEQEKDQWKAILNSEEMERKAAEDARDAVNQSLAEVSDTYLTYYYHTRLWYTLDWLERFRAQGDWLMAAVVVEQTDSLFNEHNVNYDGAQPQDRNPTPLQAARYLELREAVLDNAGCLTLERFTTDPDEQDYTERPDLIAGRYDEETVDTAYQLWAVVSAYSDPEDNRTGQCAQFTAELYSNRFFMSRLYGGSFSDSTVELYQLIFDELLDRGQLELGADGKVTVTPTPPAAGVSRETSQPSTQPDQPE